MVTCNTPHIFDAFGSAMAPTMVILVHNHTIAQQYVGKSTVVIMMLAIVMVMMTVPMVVV